MPKPEQNPLPPRLGAVESYALARVSPHPGGMITCSAVFDDYRAWCARSCLITLREPAFTAAFEEFAREVGIRLRQRGGNLSFMDMALTDTQNHRPDGR